MKEEKQTKYYKSIAAGDTEKNKFAERNWYENRKKIIKNKKNNSFDEFFKSIQRAFSSKLNSFHNFETVFVLGARARSRSSLPYTIQIIENSLKNYRVSKIKCSTQNFIKFYNLFLIFEHPIEFQRYIICHNQMIKFNFQKTIISIPQSKRKKEDEQTKNNKNKLLIHMYHSENGGRGGSNY